MCLFFEKIFQALQTLLLTFKENKNIEFPTADSFQNVNYRLNRTFQVVQTTFTQTIHST